jgi:hypothetical protein
LCDEAASSSFPLLGRRLARRTIVSEFEEAFLSIDLKVGEAWIPRGSTPRLTEEK